MSVWLKIITYAVGSAAFLFAAFGATLLLAALLDGLTGQWPAGPSRPKHGAVRGDRD